MMDNKKFIALLLLIAGIFLFASGFKVAYWPGVGYKFLSLILFVWSAACLFVSWLVAANGIRGG